VTNQTSPIACIVLLLHGCASAPPAPLDAQIAATEVAERTSPEVLARALDLADLRPLGIPRPDSRDRDPNGAAFWHACAWAFEANTRIARNLWHAAQARRDGAGLPRDVSLAANTVDVAEPDRQTAVSVAFDVLGILGLGRSAAAARLADADVRHALAAVETEVWRARFAVDRARVRVAASRTRQAALAELTQQVTKDRTRIDILSDRGWVPEGSVQTTRALMARLGRTVENTRAATARARATLASIAGLPADAPALDLVTTATLGGFAPNTTPPSPSTPRALFEQRPDLRAALLRYAISEAHVRVAAARSWPEVGLGSRLQLSPDQLLTGGILSVTLPWPGAVDAAVRRAVAVRNAERARVEQAFVDAHAEITARAVVLTTAQATVTQHGPSIETATRAAWRAIRAKFTADPKELSTWNDALERRLAGVLAHIDAREAAILAWLDLTESLGEVRR
jgi:outer membrane protein TolC